MFRLVSQAKSRSVRFAVAKVGLLLN